MPSVLTTMGGKPNKLVSWLTARQLAPAALALLLTACGGAPTYPSDPDSGAQIQRDQIQQLLRAADSSPTPRRQAYLLQAAGLLLDAGQTAMAGNLLMGLDVQTLDIDLSLQYQLLVARWQVANGDPLAALNALETQTFLLNQDRLTPEQLRQQGELRAASQALMGNHLAAASERVYLSEHLGDDAQQAENEAALWRELMHLPREELLSLAQTSSDEVLRGWLSLAAIAKDNRGDLVQQLQQLDTWRATSPGHPAAQRLPGGLELLQQLAANQPKRVALLLPLTGPLADYGQAVLDGFMSAHYETRRHGGHGPALRVYDTQLGDIDQLYDQAVAEGAELIVGPLDKQRVRQLAQRLGLPVPTLALNRVDEDVLPPLEMYQFALAPEDEARQLARIGSTHSQRAMVLAPDTERSARIVSSFVDEWQQLGGDIVAEGYYQEQKDYSKVIEQALHLDQSARRAQRVSQLLQSNMEFTPRRRQDVEMIFLQARPQQARSLVPLLAYHYAGDIPVYGTSQLFTGVSNNADSDLNGVRFTDMPWVLTSDPARQELESLRPKQVSYRRLVAFGVDSYQLYPRLMQLEALPLSRLYGKSGTLRLNSHRQIERDSMLAEFRHGKVIAVPIVESERTAKELPNDEEAKERHRDWLSYRGAGS